MDAAQSGDLRRDVGSCGSSSRPGAVSGEEKVLQYCDFRDFLRFLGIDPRVDASGLVMVAAHHMFASALPPHWSEHIDESSSRVYFFNKLTGESAWSHPQEALFRELIDEVRCWRPDECIETVFARSDAHLRQAHARAVESMSQWSGPYDAPQGPEEAPEFGGESSQFFYNATTGESRWSDPRQSVEFDLRQCHSILSECVAGHTQTLAKMSSNDELSSDGEDERRPPLVQAFVQNLWESIGTLPLPSRQIEAPADAVPKQGLPTRPAFLAPGDDTVRSSMSYLTARSETSCTAEARGELDARVDALANHQFAAAPSSSGLG